MRAMVERANLGEVEMELITHAHTLNHQPLHLGGGGGGGGGPNQRDASTEWEVGAWRGSMIRVDGAGASCSSLFDGQNSGYGWVLGSPPSPTNGAMHAPGSRDSLFFTSCEALLLYSYIVYCFTL